MSTRNDESTERLAEFNDFYTGVHLNEVLRGNPGFVSAARYELRHPDARGVPAPRFLAVYGVADEESARRFAERSDGPPEGRVVYSAGPPAWQRATLDWRLIWRRVVTTGDGPAVGAGGDVSPDLISLIGMNPAGDADTQEITEFDDFYTTVHLPEVVTTFGYDRGTRLALWREFRHPAPGCPGYLAAYEVAGDNHPPANAPALSEGPRAWRDRDVRWRVKYQRIG